MSSDEQIPYSHFASIYDSVMEGIGFKRWTNFIISSVYVVDKLPQEVLDLGCGTGLLLGHFPKQIERWGFDISEAMLQVARTNYPDCHFENQTLTDFKTPRPFELIVCTHDALNYLTTYSALKDHFISVQKTLKPNGYYFVDITTEYNILTNFSGKSISEWHNDTHFYWKNEYNPKTKEFISYLTFSKAGVNEMNPASEVHVQKLHSTEEIISVAEEAGLTLLRLGGDYVRWKPRKDDCQTNFLFQA
jgi:trans-aconitate methyltransferase